MEKPPKKPTRTPLVGRAVFYANIEKVRAGLEQRRTITAIYEELGGVPLSYSQFARYARELAKDMGLKGARPEAAAAPAPATPASTEPKTKPAAPKVATAAPKQAFRVNPTPDPKDLI
ncbi:hypothetical protein V8J38_16865 (plasmid) [Brevundimonas olei]|uniref:Conjugal transfer protein TraK n=1 Tax=Brevundimonas olei TaxID=657642 RepID=A0ABZ2IG04_9CAUL